MDDHDASKDVCNDSEPDGSNADSTVPRLVKVESPGGNTTTYTYQYDPEPIRLRFEFQHLAGKRLFCVTEPGGKTEYFRDNATRYLVVEPDAETGELWPLVKRGRPVYLSLCREEREVRMKEEG